MEQPSLFPELTAQLEADEEQRLYRQLYNATRNNSDALHEAIALLKEERYPAHYIEGLQEITAANLALLTFHLKTRHGITIELDEDDADD